LKILISGTTGFIGRYLIAQNFSDVEYVYVTRSRSLMNKNNYFHISDLSKETNWDGAFKGIDSIIHLAGLAHSQLFSVSDYQSVNVQGTLKFAIGAAKSGVKRFVFVSTIGVNGSSTKDDPFTINSIETPQNPYTQSKFDAELGLKKIAADTGMELVIVRPTLVYGPNAPGNFGLLTSLINRLPFLPFSFVNNKRDFIAVQNLTDLLITCAVHPDAAGHIFLASDGEVVSIKEFTDAIAQGLGKKLFQLPVPIFLMRLGAKFLGKSDVVNQLVGNLQVDSSNIQEVLEWSPPYTMKQAMAFLSEDKVECK